MSGTSNNAIVIGGGIVGLATAFRLLQAKPGLRLRLLDRNGLASTAVLRPGMILKLDGDTGGK